MDPASQRYSNGPCKSAKTAGRRRQPGPGEYWSGPGRGWLASLELPAVSRELAEDDLALIDALQGRIDRLAFEIHQRARSDPQVKVLTQLPGARPSIAPVILAEIGDISRFGSARSLRAHLQDGMCGRNGSAQASGRCVMAVAGGLDLHQGQLTFDYVDLGTGECWR